MFYKLVFSSEITEITPELTRRDNKQTSFSSSSSRYTKGGQSLFRLLSKNGLDSSKPCRRIRTAFSLTLRAKYSLPYPFSDMPRVQREANTSSQDQPNHNTPTDSNQSTQFKPISAVLTGPRVPRDVNNSPQDQTDHSASAENSLQNHSILTSVETHTSLNTSTNNPTHSTSQHNSETKHPQHQYRSPILIQYNQIPTQPKSKHL